MLALGSYRVTPKTRNPKWADVRPSFGPGYSGSQGSKDLAGVTILLMVQAILSLKIAMIINNIVTPARSF